MKDFKRGQFGVSGYNKFPTYKESFPPPSNKKDSDRKIPIFIAWIFLMMLTNVVYTFGVGALFLILDSSGMYTAGPGLWNIFLFVSVFQFLRQWDSIIKLGSKKN